MRLSRYGDWKIDRKVSTGYCWLRSLRIDVDDTATLVSSLGSDGSSNVTSSRGIRPATHISLSALKKLIPWPITLDQQDGTGGTVSVTSLLDTAMPTITLPTRTGYTFGGYFTGTSGTGTQYYNADGTSARNWDIDSNTTLYAKWTPITYYIAYDGNGATSGSMINTLHTYDFAQALTSNTYTRLGYRFIGWGTTSDSTTPNYSDGQNVLNLNATDGEIVTLYAIWDILYYTVTFVSSSTDYGTILNEGKTENFVYGETYTSYAIPKVGCALLYWLDGANPGAPIYDNPLAITVTENKTYTAYFTNSLTQGIMVTSTIGGSVELLGDDFAELADNDTITLVARIKLNGYKFDGWFVQGETTAFSTAESVRALYGEVKDKAIIARFSKISANINDDTDNTNEFY